MKNEQKKKEVNFFHKRLSYRRKFSAQDVLGKTQSESKYSSSCANCGTGACADGQCD